MAQLNEEIRDFLNEGFTFFWVVGEVQRCRRSQRGHLYLELVEKGAGDRIIGKIDAVLWRTAHRRIRHQLAHSGQEIVDGQQIRCGGRLDYYGPAGRLQLIVSEVDPLFSLGHLERRRREILAALAATGRLEQNRQLALPAVPLRLGLVTSKESAAFHDFLTGLAESAFGFQVFFIHASVQGHQAEAEVTAALRALGRPKLASRLDAVVLIRGGGSRSDLAVFDSRRVAEAIVRSPWPVLTGLGHEIDQAIADIVCHTALKTPTKVAEFLVDRVSEAERRLQACEAATVALSREALRRARSEMARFDRLPRSAALRLGKAQMEVDEKVRTLGWLGRRSLQEAKRGLGVSARRLGVTAPRLLARRRLAPELLARRLVEMAKGRLREGQAVVDGIERLCGELSPERVLERGYSITRDTAGRILQRSEQVNPGDEIETRLSGGVLRSRVEET